MAFKKANDLLDGNLNLFIRFRMFLPTSYMMIVSVLLLCFVIVSFVLDVECFKKSLSKRVKSSKRVFITNLLTFQLTGTDGNGGVKLVKDETSP